MGKRRNLRPFLLCLFELSRFVAVWQRSPIQLGEFVHRSLPQWEIHWPLGVRLGAVIQKSFEPNIHHYIFAFLVRVPIFESKVPNFFFWDSISQIHFESKELEKNFESISQILGGDFQATYIWGYIIFGTLDPFLSSDPQQKIIGSWVNLINIYNHPTKNLTDSI